MTVVSSDSLEASTLINQPEIPISVVINIGEEKNILDSNKKKKKKAGPFSFFRAALVALRSTDNNKKWAPTKQLDNNDSVVDDGNWKKIVGSMRPLHLQQDMTTESPPTSLPPPSPTRSVTDESSLHPFQQPFSPSPSYSSAGTMSQYASASNLQALVNGDEEEEEDDPDIVFDAIRGDEMIDSKAEEFIAQFYQQMKIDKHHHHYHHHRGKSTQF